MNIGPQTPSAYTQYGTTANAYQSFLNGGSSPINYNVPAQSIRAQPGVSSFSTGGRTPQERIQSMVDRGLERFDAQLGIRQGMYDRYMTDYNNATQGARAQLAQSPYGLELNRQSFGGNSYTGDGYQKFMAGQGLGGVLGGTNSSPSQRYRAFNNEINNRQNLAYQTLSPLWAKYGTSAPSGSTPRNLVWG